MRLEIILDSSEFRYNIIRRMIKRYEDERYMSLALREAEQAFREDEVPVGAVVVIDGNVVAAEHNRREQTQDPTAHAEVLAIRRASEKTGGWRLTDATVYVTKEPCPMCAGAILNARVKRLVFGCKDPKGGAVESLYRITTDERLSHRVEVKGGVLAEECSKLLRRFFRQRRENKDLT
jgi:tRNA(adenine34) deaminase